MTAEFWDKRSRKYDEAIKDHDAGYKQTIEKITARLSDSDVVLDFACGSGEIALDIAPHVGHIYGLDTSAKMIDLAKEKARERKVGNADFVRADAFDQQFDNLSLSAILALNVLHLVDDIPRAINRLRDLLPSGGLLITQTPCLGERALLFQYLIGFFQKIGMAPAILNLKIAELESLVIDAGFEIIETKVWDEKDAIQWIIARKPSGTEELI